VYPNLEDNTIPRSDLNQFCQLIFFWSHGFGFNSLTAMVAMTVKVEPRLGILAGAKKVQKNAGNSHW